MDSMIALLIFFTFLYIIEKITEKREKRKEQQAIEEEKSIEEVFSDNCPYCNRKVTYLENICGNCRQELKWE